MLYKKFHRQYVKEFRLGRKFRYNGGNIFEVTREPCINKYYIYIEIEKKLYDCNILRLIPLTLLNKGKLWCKKEIKWLN